MLSLYIQIGLSEEEGSLAPLLLENNLLGRHFDTRAFILLLFSTYTKLCGVSGCVGILFNQPQRRKEPANERQARNYDIAQ